MQNNSKILPEILVDSALTNPFTDLFQRDLPEDEPGLAIASAIYAKESYGNYSQAVLNLHTIAGALVSPQFEAEENPYLKLVHVKAHPEISLKFKLIKRIFDILFSLIIMILGFPVFAALYLVTKFSSPGPVFFKQERVGKNQRKFHIYKFRSMHVDAEKAGPQLSNATDPRITRWGRIIRRTRLDELPQFYNVIRGDMSVVGPRPERQYFIDKIVERKPDYRHLQRLKPGITSMGQVHYGYAENIDQMCDRMVYDLHYIKNPNLRADISIIMKTVKVMFECKGK